MTKVKAQKMADNVKIIYKDVWLIEFSDIGWAVQFWDKNRWGGAGDVITYTDNGVIG